jgi:hypothetical protein
MSFSYGLFSLRSEKIILSNNYVLNHVIRKEITLLANKRLIIM